jgi:hypothetical protein
VPNVLLQERSSGVAIIKMRPNAAVDLRALAQYLRTKVCFAFLRSFRDIANDFIFLA